MYLNKFYFTLLAFFIFNFLTAQSTSITDPDFEQYLVTQGIDSDGLVNGTILNSDAAAVTTLTMSGNLNIEDFTGLEAFVNVVTMNLGANQFATLPLSTLTLLESLTFTNNDALASLNVSANIALKILNIASNTSNVIYPPITSLDLSQNTNLEQLRLYAFNNLSNLNLPANNTLWKIEIYYLGAPEIDLSLQHGLEDLYINRSTVSVNLILPNETSVLKKIQLAFINFPIINLSPYIALENINLSSTNVENLTFPTTNSLKSIVVITHKLQHPISMSSAPMLTNLDFTTNNGTIPLDIDLTGNPNIKTLWLTSNLLNNIDLTQNTLLEKLYIQNNDLIVLDVTQNVMLETFYAYDNLLSGIDITQNVQLKYLNLSQNLLTNTSVDFSQNILLNNLSINNNLYDTTGPDLSQNTVLHYLDISNNQVASLDISNNVELVGLVAHHNLFSGTDILDQLYAIKSGYYGLSASNIIDVSFNNLSGTIPDFAGLESEITNYFRFNFNDNEFHFGDFENQHDDFLYYMTHTNTFGSSQLPIMTIYSYAPQAKVNEIETLNENAGNTITLTTIVRGAQNHYQWFKDDIAIPTAPDSPYYTLYDVNSCDAGVYHCEITSDLVPFENANPPGTNGKNLLLVRNDITLNVNYTESCVSLAQPLNGATNVPINTGITWSENSGACGYFLSVGTNTAATNLISNLDVGEVNTYNFTSNLSPSTVYYVKIIPYFASGNTLTCSIYSFTTSSVTTIPSCNTLIYPENNATQIPIDTNLSWNPANGVEGYTLSIGTTSGGTDLVNNLNVGNVTTYNLPTDLPYNTTIYVTLTPYNTAGNATGCTQESFTTEPQPIVIPGCTNLSNPLANATNVSITTDLTWNSVTSATSYTLSVGTTSGGTDLVNNLNVGNVTTYNLPTDLPYNTTIYVTLTPYNTAGNATGCTQESFTTEPQPIVIPGCTNLSNPLANATNVSITTNINWNSAGTATGYTLSVGTTSGGTDLVNNLNVGNVTTYNLLTDLPYNTIIYVTLTPYNTAGNATGCTQESFTTEPQPIVIPGCTNFSNPLANATNVSITTDLTWNSVTSATGYTLSVGTTSGGTDLVNNLNVGNVTTYNLPTDLPYNTTIYVTLTPYNTAGNATGCTQESFTTEPQPIVIPGCTNLSNPLANATNVSITTNLTWNSVTSATGYTLSVGTTSGGTDLVNNLNVGNVTTYNLPTDLPYNTTIYVTLTPYNTAGNATGCTQESFTTEPQPIVIPGCTNLSNPLANATNVSITTDLTWNSVTSATGYTLSVGTTSGGTDLVNNLNVGNVTTYNLLTDLPYNTTIYVTLTPYNTAGNATGCTQESFTTEMPVLSETKYGISPDGDGINDYLEIVGIEMYPQNIISIYNRWGDLVFEMQHYNNLDNRFEGIANKSRELGADTLPEGTYFFVLDINANTHKVVKGFIVLKR